MQEAVLFDRTLKENLLLGKPSATTAEPVARSKLAGLEDCSTGCRVRGIRGLDPEAIRFREASASVWRWLVQCSKILLCFCWMNRRHA